MMTNVIQQKSVYCIEWILETASKINYVNAKTCEHTSEHFSFLNHKCNLKFKTQSNYGILSSDIIFESDEELNPAVEVLATFTGNLGLHSETHLIKGRNQIIWKWNYSLKEPFLFNQLLTFVLTTADNPLKDDKSMQTPFYFDSSPCLESISREFSKLLHKGPNHDVIFICEGQTIPAHKNVLCCRSSVFTSMLQSNKLEGTIGEVKIQDMNASIFKQFLNVLYTGVLPELTVDIAIQFYKASDKYAIDTIKEQCAEFLVDHLSTGNACEILIVADKHGDLDFKKSVMEYILKEEIPFAEENWTDFCRENKELAIEVLNLFCRHLRATFTE